MSNQFSGWVRDVVLIALAVLFGAPFALGLIYLTSEPLYKFLTVLTCVTWVGWLVVKEWREWRASENLQGPPH